MATTVYFTTFAKRRNSTAQFLLSGAQSFSCTLKAPTSLQRPTFHISYATYFDFNVACWEGRYYFVDDAVSVGEGRWEVTLVVDVLATYKSQIIAGDYFVVYASDSSLKNEYIADYRIPLTKRFNWGEVNDDTEFSTTGSYILTVNGENGCRIYACSLQDINDLINNISTWGATDVVQYETTDASGNLYQWGTTEECIESLAKMLNQSGFYGNSYADAPNNIKNCLWIPIKLSNISGTTQRIYLGRFDTGIDAKLISNETITVTCSLDLTFLRPASNYDYWERGYREEYNIYLPFVGCVPLPSNTLAAFDTVKVDRSVSLVDGNVVYKIYGETPATPYPLTYIIGTYGASCASGYSIGVSQDPSLGAVVQTAFSGVEKSVNALIQSDLGPQSIVGAAAGVVLHGMQTGYNIKDVVETYNNATYGSFGGRASVQLGLDIRLFFILHDLVDDPDNVALALGYPVQRYLSSLTNISGYVQCVNAHCESNADAEEKDAIDFYLNSGFYIE